MFRGTKFNENECPIGNKLTRRLKDISLYGVWNNIFIDQLGLVSLGWGPTRLGVCIERGFINIRRTRCRDGLGGSNLECWNLNLRKNILRNWRHKKQTKPSWNDRTYIKCLYIEGSLSKSVIRGNYGDWNHGKRLWLCCNLRYDRNRDCNCLRKCIGHINQGSLKHLKLNKRTRNKKRRL